MKQQIVIIAHNLRSAHNVGSILRTAEGLGIKTVYLTGYTPYPRQADDERLPHLAEKITKQIDKTALGASQFQSWKHFNDIQALITELKDEGFEVIAIEQAPKSTSLHNFSFPSKIAMVVGREVEGMEPEVLAACDCTVEIPMVGRKESFNVSVAAAIAMYAARFAG